MPGDRIRTNPSAGLIIIQNIQVQPLRISINPVAGEPSAWELTTRVVVPTPQSEAFAFFADAENLETITPSWLRFRIVTPMPIEMREGALIDYRLKISGIPVKWRTEITAWEPPVRFVDTQLRGPYREWVHEHTFSPVADGTRVDDRVTYRVPGGRLMNTLYVKRALRRIFEYRRDRLLELLSGDTQP